MGHIITLAQQKGGAGKTTVLAHLAHAWSDAGKSVAILDLDPQRSLTYWSELSDLPITLVETRDYRAGGDIRDAAKAHDIVLVDCPGSVSTMLEAALRESDLILAPCQPTAMDVWATGPILEMAGKAKTPVRVLMNRVPPRGTALTEAVENLKAAKADVLKARFGNRVAFANGFAKGTTALGLSKRSMASSEVIAARKEIDRLLKNL